MTATTRRSKKKKTAAGEGEGDAVSPEATTATTSTPVRKSPRRRKSKGSAKSNKDNENDESNENVESQPKKRRVAVSRKSAEDEKEQEPEAVAPMDVDEEEQPKQAQEESTRDAVDPPEGQQQKEKPASAIKSKRKRRKAKPKKYYPPTLDVHVHRVRDLNYKPAQITALAAATSTASNSNNNNEDDGGYVAVARNDGSYQLSTVSVLEEFRRECHSHWVPVCEIPAATAETATSTTATSLCWVTTHPNRPPTCVAASGLLGNLWIVDFEHVQPVSCAIPSGGGGVFDLVVCDPPTTSSSTTDSQTLPLVAGACQDGSVRIWRVARTDKNNEQDGSKAMIVDPPLVTVPSMGAPILSLTWRVGAITKQSSQSQQQQQEENRSSFTTKSTVYQTVLFAAVADGTIRKYRIDVKQTDFTTTSTSSTNNSTTTEYTVPHAKSMLRMTIESKGRRTPTKVWSMKLLQDGTLIAGNSLGQVQFWNSDTGTLIQTVMQSPLLADVLKVVVSQNESKVFCSGVDSRVVCIERVVPLQDGNDGHDVRPSTLLDSAPWKITYAHRPHSHDVKAMVIVPGAEYPNGDQQMTQKKGLPRRLETLISGGVDTKICSYDVAFFDEKRPQTWYPWPLESPISTSSNPSQSRLLSMQRSEKVELYRLDDLPNSPETTNGEQKEHDKLLAQEAHKYRIKETSATDLVGTIQLGGASGATSSSRLLVSQLSPDGSFLAVSNGRSVFAFRLDSAKSNDAHDPSNESPPSALEVTPIQVQLPSKLRRVNATALHFCGNVLFVADSAKRQIHIIHLKDETGGENIDEESSELSMSTFSIPKHQQTKDVELPIQSIHTTSSGKYVVAMSRYRNHGIHIFQKDGNNGSAIYKHHWTIPSLGGFDARPAALTFMQKKLLAIATYQSHIYIFDLENKKLSPWSETNGFPIQSDTWTMDSICLRDFPTRLMCRNGSQLIMSSFGTFSVIDTNQPIPEFCRFVPEKHIRRRIYRKPVPLDIAENPWLQPRVSKPITDEDEESNDEDEEETDTNEKNKDKTSEPDPDKISRACTVCLQYNNILHMNFLGPNEMVVVEQPWLDVVETLPDPLQRRVYGCN